jgi:hypothetical protein
VDDDDSDGGGVGDTERLDDAGVVGGAINGGSSVAGDGTTVINCDRGLDCGGERTIDVRCNSNRLRCCLRLFISSSSMTLLRLSSLACLANAAAETCLDLPRRWDGGGGF